MEIIIELPALSPEGRVLFQAYPLTRFMPYPPFAHWPSPSKAQLSTIACLISSFNTPFIRVQPQLTLSLSLSSEDHVLFQAPLTKTLMPIPPYAHQTYAWTLLLSHVAHVAGKRRSPLGFDRHGLAGRE